MSLAKIAGILGALITLAIFAAGFGHIQFGYYTPPANIPAIDVAGLKWACAALALVSIWALATIGDAPAPGRSR